MKNNEFFSSDITSLFSFSCAIISCRAPCPQLKDRVLKTKGALKLFPKTLLPPDSVV